ncbi:TetR/AcrR family transcriptional regulator [Microbacteriaceae bacterium VKM Ac-2855]|nr:TetR/AcrR family transcriptional regulator [Microbacteriaceae bacterium VKM Ac-2855]
MPRPRRFDEYVLLDGAQELFWKRGYEQTSIDDVARVTGVGNGSIYAAYGSKLGLFVAVFRRYCAGRVALVESVVATEHGDFAAVVAGFLEAIVVDCTGRDDRRGCLMLNGLAELSARFPDVGVIGYEAMARMNDVLAVRVRSAIEANEIRLDPDEAYAVGAHLVVVSQGLINLSRIGVSPDELRSIAAASVRMTAGLRAA